MSYKNIVFVKLEKRLLNDPRWYMLSETSQLNYIRFILCAADNYNRIPKELKAIKLAFKTNQRLITIKKSIEEIRKNFPKFKEGKEFYYFDGFEEKTNYIPKREIPGKSPGHPQDGVEEEEEEEEEEDPPRTGGKDKSVFTEEEKTVLETVNKKTNIYALIEDFKNTHKAYPLIPMLMGVCRQFLEKGAEIKEPYPYLKAALHRAAQDEENLNWKKQGIFSLKDILTLCQK